jgi:CxxC motif-containing protein (DUF1111 family)
LSGNRKTQLESPMLKQFVAVLLSLVIPVVAASPENSYKVRYDGGSVPSVKSGSDVKLFIEEGRVRLVKDKKDVLVIPASSITEVTYGQDVHRRVGAAVGIGVVTLGVGALMALTKSKKHFIGMTYDDDGKKGGFAFQADKGEYRGLLSGLEGVSGKKALNSDTMTVKN